MKDGKHLKNLQNFINNVNKECIYIFCWTCLSRPMYWFLLTEFHKGIEHIVQNQSSCKRLGRLIHPMLLQRFNFCKKKITTISYAKELQVYKHFSQASFGQFKSSPLHLGWWFLDDNATSLLAILQLKKSS
jgi:hypothetical protein